MEKHSTSVTLFLPVTYHCHTEITPPSIYSTAVPVFWRSLMSPLCAKRVCNLSSHIHCTQKQQKLIAVTWYTFHVHTIYRCTTRNNSLHIQEDASSSDTSMAVYQTRQHHILDDLKCTVPFKQLKCPQCTRTINQQ